MLTREPAIGRSSGAPDPSAPEGDAQQKDPTHHYPFLLLFGLATKGPRERESIFQARRAGMTTPARCCRRSTAVTSPEAEVRGVKTTPHFPATGRPNSVHSFPDDQFGSGACTNNNNNKNANFTFSLVLVYHGFENDRPVRTFQADTPLSGARSANIDKPRKPKGPAFCFLNY
jgi:hypothetical protein